MHHRTLTCAGRSISRWRPGHFENDLDSWGEAEYGDVLREKAGGVIASYKSCWGCPRRPLFCIKDKEGEDAGTMPHPPCSHLPLRKACEAANNYEIKEWPGQIPGLWRGPEESGMQKNVAANTRTSRDIMACHHGELAHMKRYFFPGRLGINAAPSPAKRTFGTFGPFKSTRLGIGTYKATPLKQLAQQRRL